MSKKKKNRQNDNTRGQNGSKNDKNRHGAKMNGHLLLARNEAAAALLRAALKEIEENAVPEVKHSHTSMQAFRQFLFFSGLFWKSLVQNIKVHVNSDNRSGISPERASERFSAAAKACGKTFLNWIGLLIAEIFTVIVLALETLFRAVWKFLCWVGFQIVRFFRYLKNLLYWKKLKYSIKHRIWKEEREKISAERKAERQEQLAKKKEEAEFRKAMKAEEEAFLKAKAKEEEAIRIAKERQEEAARMTAKIESELAALSLQRKEEEEKVLQETKRKEEAMAALTEASREEEAERARLEERRKIEEEARIEAEKQEAEAEKRLAEMQKAEEERIAKAEAEFDGSAGNAEPSAEPVSEESTEAESAGKESHAAEETKAEFAGSEESAEPSVSENPAEPEAVTAEDKTPETEKPEAPVAETPEPSLKEEPAAETPLVPEVQNEETETSPAKPEEPAETEEKGTNKGIPASAARSAVRSLPVHMPTISVPDHFDAKELITEARDNTNGVIYRVVKSLEVPKATESVQTALIACAAKYAAIGLAAAVCAWIGTAHHPGNAARPSGGTFVLLFFLIFIIGVLLSAGLSWLSGLLVMRRAGGKENEIFLKENSRYVPISALAYIVCFLILTFSRSKFIAVLVAVILLSMIGHLMVMFREKRVPGWYSLLVYLLCILIAAAVIILIGVLFSSQLHAIWNALG